MRKIFITDPARHGLDIQAASKYRSKRQGKYASQKEAKRAAELKLLEREGLITDLVEQPRFQLIPASPPLGPVHYVADFAYNDVEAGMRIVEDVKGVRTPVYRLKKRLMKFMLGIDVVEI